MDKYTFGSSKCATDLVDIVEKSNEKLSKKISRVLQDYNTGLNEINKTSIMRKALLILWRHEYYNKIKNMNLPDDIKNRLNNIIVGTFRKAMEMGK